MKLRAVALVAISASLPACNRHAPDKMSFFVTSRPAGEGGNIGGLTGADAHCQRLADAAGSKKSWRAYLSAGPEGGQPAVHARDRIGKGPWLNSRGEQIAASLEDLHGPSNKLGLKTVLPESGERVRYPHDILTGSSSDGTLAKGDMTCRNWSGTIGFAMVGHSDRQGGMSTGASWNSAHQSGCTSAELASNGGSSRLYCFAID
jgi:hypothetical protein